MGTIVEGFSFDDFCQRCQKIMSHNIELEGRKPSGVCTACGERRPIEEPNQVYYPRTDLWVTRFKIGNLPSVVTGKLLDALKRL